MNMEELLANGVEYTAEMGRIEPTELIHGTLYYQKVYGKTFKENGVKYIIYTREAEQNNPNGWYIPMMLSCEQVE